MSLLPTIGVLTYNTVTMNVLHNTKIIATPIKDEANRTIICYKHRLSLEAWIRAGDYAAGSTTDNDLDALKAKLLQPAGQLTFTTKGYGNLTVNVSSAKDVMWGPMPELLEWIPIGSNQTVLIHYELEWHAPICNGSTSYQNTLMAFNWDYNVNLDRQGLSVRTVSGYFEIPMTRFTAGSKLLPDMVDRYREEVVATFPVPVGFRREQTFHVSKDKRRCDFAVTDTEIASQNPLPDGVTEATIRHSLTTQSKAKTAIFQEWYWRMSGTITVAPQLPTAYAWQKFLVYLNDRLRWLKNNQALIPSTNGQILLIPTKFEWEEEVTGLSSNFSVEYYIMCGGASGSRDLSNVVYASGLWKPLEETNWLTWKSSMEKLGVNTPRGSAGLLLDTQHDAIVDLCVGDSAPTGPSGAYTKNRKQIPTLPIINLNPFGIWLWYQNELSIVGNPGKAYHWPLAPNQKAIEHVKWDGSRCTFMMEGWAWRFCIATPVPELLSINGKPVKQVGETETNNKVVRYLGGWPVVQTWWRKYYILPEPVPDGDMPKIRQGVPGNPVMRQAVTPDQGMKQRQMLDSPGLRPQDWKE